MNRGLTPEEQREVLREEVARNAVKILAPQAGTAYSRGVEYPCLVKYPPSDVVYFLFSGYTQNDFSDEQVFVGIIGKDLIISNIIALGITDFLVGSGLGATYDPFNDQWIVLSTRASTGLQQFHRFNPDFSVLISDGLVTVPFALGLGQQILRAEGGAGIEGHMLLGDAGANVVVGHVVDISATPLVVDRARVAGYSDYWLGVFGGYSLVNMDPAVLGVREVYAQSGMFQIHPFYTVPRLPNAGYPSGLAGYPYTYLFTGSKALDIGRTANMVGSPIHPHLTMLPERRRFNLFHTIQWGGSSPHAQGSWQREIWLYRIDYSDLLPQKQSSLVCWAVNESNIATDPYTMLPITTFGAKTLKITLQASIAGQLEVIELPNVDGYNLSVWASTLGERTQYPPLDLNLDEVITYTIDDPSECVLLKWHPSTTPYDLKVYLNLKMGES